MRRLPCAVLLGLLLPLLGPVAAPPAFPEEPTTRDAPARPAPPVQVLPDRFPADKALHGMAGASAALLGAAVTSALAAELEPGAAAGTAAAVGFGTAALVGLAKELLDLAGAGDPDPLDYLCTLIGGAAAAAGAYGLLRSQAVAEDPTRLSVPLASFGIVLALPVAGAWCIAVRQTGHPTRDGNAAYTVLR